MSHTNTHEVGQAITVDIADTVGQSSAIGANGGSVFTIEVTTSSFTWDEPTGTKQMIGFGRVVSGGPVNGYEVGYLTEA